MSLSRRATRGALFNVIGSYGQMALSFISTLALARLLAPENFGTFGLAIATYEMLGRARSLGFEAIYFSLPQPDERDTGTYLRLTVAFSSLVMVLAALAQPLLGKLYGQLVARLTLALAFVAVFDTVGGAGNAPNTLLRRDFRYYEVALLGTLAVGVQMIVTLILAMLGWSVWALFAGFAAKTLVGCIGSFAYAPRIPFSIFDRERAGHFLRHGRNLWLGAMGSFLAFMYDDLAVGTISGEAPLGNYRKAYDLSLVPLAFVNGVAGVMSSVYSAARDSRDALTRAMTTILDIETKLVFPIGVWLALAAQEIVPLYLGDQWHDAIPMLQALVIYSVFRPMNDVSGQLVNVLGHTEVMRTRGIATSVFMVASCTLMTLWLGAVGAALAAGATVLVGLGIIYLRVIRHYTDVAYVEVFVPPLLALAGGALLTLALETRLPEGLLVRLALKSAIFAGSYAGLLGLMQGRVVLRKFRDMWALFRAKE